MKKLLALVLALTLVLGLATVAFAEGAENPTGTITITVPSEETAPDKPVTYSIYKVFDATVGENGAISYSWPANKIDQKPIVAGNAKFDTDAGGNVIYYTRADAESDWVANTTAGLELSDEMIAAIAAFVGNDEPVATAVAQVGDTTATATVPYGYYYITTTTGTLVTVDSTTPNASVADKNTLSIVVKSAGTEYDEESLKAIAAVGTSQPFTAEITVGKGAKNVVFSDAMTNMVFNNDLVITVNGEPVAASDTTWSLSVANDSKSFTVTFTDAYIAGLSDDATITLNYSGTITSDALSDDPATNTATITTGEGNGYSYTPDTPVEVYNAKLTVSKKDGNNAALAGAGFVIKNSEGKYYKLVAATETDPMYIDWVDSIDDATEYVSGDDGEVPAFTGLGAGTYTLVEKTTPAGYNTAADYEFTIVDDDFTTDNLELTTDVINESGTELPSTGGIGTTIFYVVGGLLAAAAVVLLITKKRLSKEN